MWTAALNLVARTANFSSMMSGAGNVARSFGNQVTSSMSKAMMASNIAQKAFSGLTQAFFQATAQARQFSNIASRLNLKPAEVAQLSEAAEDAGIPLMALTRGMRDIQRFGAQGLGGNLKGELKEAANLLGLSNSEFKVMAAGGKDAMALVASKMRDMDDEAKKFLITQKLHGRNAQFLGQIYEKSGEEIEDMFKKQIASSDETIAANKKIYQGIDTIKDAWNTMLAWVVARFEWLVTLIAMVVQALADVGTVIGKIWELLKSGLTVFGDSLEFIVAFLSGDWEGAADMFNKLSERFKNLFKDAINAIGDFFKSRWTAWIDSLKSLTPDWILRLFGISPDQKVAGSRKSAKDWVKENYLKEAPARTEEEKAADKKANEELDAEREKMRLAKMNDEERAAYLAERRKQLAGEVDEIRKKYAELEEEKMQKMGKIWAIPPEAFKTTKEYYEWQKKLLELQKEEEENERKLLEAEKERREAAEKAANEELERQRKAAQAQRAVQDEVFDAQVELTRRNLEESNASAVEKAQFELAVEQEKMSRLQREMIIANREGDAERQAELRREILGQSLTLDSASRSLNKAQMEQQKAEQDALLGGVAGVGSSLTAVGGGGNIAFAPMDIAKAQLSVQQSMNANLTAIREMTAARSGANVGYASNRAVVKSN